MTFLPVDDHDAVALDEVAAALAPLIGERAVGLFGHAIADGFGGAAAAASRAALIARGENPDHPEVTDAEQLLLDWGRAIGADPRAVPTELDARLEATFAPASRVALVAFASRALAAAAFRSVGRVAAPTAE